jgi:hypothetical protein
MADISLYNVDPSTATGVQEYLGHVRNAVDSIEGINHHYIRQGGELDTIVIGGIEYQGTTFWNIDEQLVVGWRANRGRWRWIVIAETVTDNDDAHYDSVGHFDPDGYYHVTYDMHSTALEYRKSTVTVQSGSAMAFGSEISMLGTNETAITYPMFFRYAGSLYFYFRADDGSSDADLYFYKYNHATETWAAAPGTIAGRLVNGDASGDVPYYGIPQTDGTTLWFICTWRTSQLSESYHDPSVWKYNGTNFLKPDGTAQTVPITLANVTILDDTTDAEGVTVYPKITVDVDGRPHVLYNKTVTAVVTSYHGVYSGGSWTYNTLPVGRDVTNYDIVVDDDLVAYIIHRDASDFKLKQFKSGANSYASWTTETIYNSAISSTVNWQPRHDLEAWRLLRRYEVMLPDPTTSVGQRLNVSAHWKLNEASGTRLPTHGSTATFNLTASASSPTATTGKIGDAARFELASTQHLLLSDNASISPTGSFSFSFWVRLTTINANNHILSKFNTAGNRSWLFGCNSGTPNNFSWSVYPDGTNSINCTTVSPVDPQTNTWYHIVCVADVTNDETRLYVDGVERATNTNLTGISAHDNGSQFRLGGTQSTAAFLNGDMDDVAFYTRALTDADVVFLYNGGSGRPFEDYDRRFPVIYSHGSTATVNEDEGNTVSIDVEYYGDITELNPQLSGTDAANYNVTNNSDGTVTINGVGPAEPGTETFTLTLSNEAVGSDTVDFTVEIAAVGGGEETAPNNKMSIKMGMGI